MKYVNFGSRWSVTGDPNASILDIFIKHNIAFFGDPSTTEEKDALNIEAGDMVVITNGTTVVAFGKALCDAFVLKQKLNKFNFSDVELDRFNYGETHSIAVKVKLTEIPEKEQFTYGGQGSKFQNFKDQSHITTINKLYAKYC